MKLWHEHTHVTISTSGQQTLPALQQLLTYPLPVNTPNWLLLSLLSPQICYSYFDLHVNGITEYVLFRDWLLSPSTGLVVSYRWYCACQHLVPFLASIMFRTTFYFISWLMGIWVGSICQLLWTFPAQVFVWTYVVTSLGFKPDGWIAGLHHKVTFNVFMGLPNCFQNRCTSLRPHQGRSGYWLPHIFSRTCYLLVGWLCLIAVTLVSVNSCLLVALLCVSLMTNDV